MSSNMSFITQMCVGICMGGELHSFHLKGGENFNVGVAERLDWGKKF